MGTTTGTVMTLANSIIGVSVLAMPFCFKLCGILLSIAMLILSSFISRLSCHFLLKSAAMARRRTFENLAFHTFGPAGKLLVEVCIIGFLLGTCIAFFVVVGDLGPAILANLLSVTNSPGLRTTVLVGLAAFVVLPLGLLRSVDSLTTVSTATIGFYVCLVLKVVAEAAPRLAAADWIDLVALWKPSGLLQCLPIFTMALFCQTQVFEVFAAWPSASLDRMNSVVKQAVNICTGVYIAVGFFGYVANAEKPFTGNVLMSFEPSPATELIKLGFVLSVAVSFPLVIFPCRASLHSLIYQRGGPPPTGGNRAPPAVASAARRVRLLTASIVAVSLCVAWAVPSIELVLGLVGSTIGVAICLGFPALAMLRTMTSASTPERPRAHAVLLIGAIILVAGTYANLSALAESPSPLDSLIPTPPVSVNTVIPDINNLKVIKDIPQPISPDEGTRREPPVPVEPAQIQSDGQDFHKKIPAPDDVRKEPPIPVEPGLPAAGQVAANNNNNNNNNKLQLEKSAENIIPKPAPEVLPEEGSMHKDALAKEDAELLEAERQQKSEAERNKLELLAKLEKHKQEQAKLLEEQKRILEEMNKHAKIKPITESNISEVKKKDEESQLNENKNVEIIPPKNNNQTKDKTKEEKEIEKKDEKIKHDLENNKQIDLKKIKIDEKLESLPKKKFEFLKKEIKLDPTPLLEKILTSDLKNKQINKNENEILKKIQESPEKKELLSENIEKEKINNEIKLGENKYEIKKKKEKEKGVWEGAVPLPIAILNGSRSAPLPSRVKREAESEDCEPRILTAQQLSSPERVDRPKPQETPPATEFNVLQGLRKKTKK